jgi:hypothetical protein
MSEVTDPELLKQLNSPSGAAGDPGRVEGGWKLGNELDLLQGVAQGLIDPVEGIVQLAEKSTGWNLAPQGIKDWARDYRKQARSTMLGMGGEVVGNLAPSLIPGGAIGTGAAWADRALTGAVAGMAQPVSGGGDYWQTKRAQTALGGAGGAVVPPVAGAAGRTIAAIPSSIMHFLHRGSPAVPLANLATQAASRLSPRAVGAVGGMARGGSPIETPEGRLRVTRDAPSPPPDDDKQPPPPLPRPSFAERFKGDEEDDQ